MHADPMPAVARRLSSIARLALIALAVTAASAAEPAADPLAALPALPRPAPAPMPEPAGGDTVVEGVRTLPDRVLLDGTLNMDKGPADGLEVLACLRDGKTHESLVRLDTTQGRYVKFACISALKLDDGQWTEESSTLPARGTPLRVRLHWRDDEGAWQAIDASSLVRDRAIDRAYPALPWVYTGSRITVVAETGPDGKPRQRERFMLDNTRSVAVIFDEPDALIASPFPSAGLDARFEVNSAIAPPAGGRVVISLERAELPLTLDADATGKLSATGSPLDDAALAAALTAAYPADAPAGFLRAVGIRIPATAERTVDAAIRGRLLAAAAAAKAWAVPLFIPVAAAP